MSVSDEGNYEVKIESPNEDTVDDEVERAAWRNKAEFVLTVVGLAVGLGNVWRFPYLCYSNGGGAFLIPYFGTLVLIGIPMFMMDLSIGQFPSLGPIGVWAVNPLFKGLGFAMVTINTFVTLYYNIIISWIIYYLIASMNSKLPWQDCDNPWNTESCCRGGIKNSTNNVVGNDNNQTVCKSPAEEYFYNKVLKISGGIEEQGTIVWELALCHLFAWVVIFLVLIKGIKSLGKVVYFSTIFPYVLLTVMLIRGVTLDGAYDGIKYYIEPDFTKLAKGKTWSDAATQIFFSLSICGGGMITMASYNPFKNNVLRDSILVPVINCLTSFYGGFAIFSVLGYMAKQKNVEISEVVQQGPGLVFVVYPEALTTMPVAPLWSVLFFLMMLTLGFSSQFSLTEVTLSAVIDNVSSIRKTRYRQILFRACACFAFFVFGLTMVTNGGFYVLTIFDSFIGIPYLYSGIVECIAVQYIYGYNNFASDIEMMLGKKPCLFFRITWCLVSPLLLTVVTITLLIQYKVPIIYNRPLPPWGQGIGFLLVGLIVVMVPIWFVVYFLRKGGWQLIKNLSKPTEEWGPAMDKYRTGKYAKSKSDVINKQSHDYYEEVNPDLFIGQPGLDVGSINKAFYENDNL